jgi:hypothetical protein
MFREKEGKVYLVVRPNEEFPDLSLGFSCKYNTFAALCSGLN